MCKYYILSLSLTHPHKHTHTHTHNTHTQIPPPYGDYIAEGGYTLCTWRHADRNKPVRFFFLRKSCFFNFFSSARGGTSIAWNPCVFIFEYAFFFQAYVAARQSPAIQCAWRFRGANPNQPVTITKPKTAKRGIHAVNGVVALLQQKQENNCRETGCRLAEHTPIYIYICI